MIKLSEADLSRSFKGVQARKATGPDGVPSCVLKFCSDQLAKVFTDILNILLSLAVVPLFFFF